MDSAHIIGNFKSLCELTAQMRELAAQGKWDELIPIEERLSKLVEKMKSEEADLDEPSRQIVVNLIRQSMEDDAEIRTQTKMRISELQKLMQSNRQKQLLSKAYG